MQFLASKIPEGDMISFKIVQDHHLTIHHILWTECFELRLENDLFFRTFFPPPFFPPSPQQPKHLLHFPYSLISNC